MEPRDLNRGRNNPNGRFSYTENSNYRENEDWDGYNDFENERYNYYREDMNHNYNERMYHSRSFQNGRQYRRFYPRYEDSFEEGFANDQNDIREYEINYRKIINNGNMCFEINQTKNNTSSMTNNVDTEYINTNKARNMRPSCTNNVDIMNNQIVNSNGNNIGLETSKATDQQTIKSHYNSISNRSLKERSGTKNINIRSLHNFIKACLIKKYIKKNDYVLDLGIGKGGDFKKYQDVGIKELYGADIANKSILDAAERFRQLNLSYKTVLKTRDCYSAEFLFKKTFDVISCMFTFHYCFDKEKNVDITINNIRNHLKPGGYVIITIPSKNEILKRLKENKLSNSYYKIDFKGKMPTELYGSAYNYNLEDSVNDCVEYLVDVEELTRKMNRSGIELVEETAFLDFLSIERRENAKCYNRMVSRELNPEEYEVVSLHQVLVYRLKDDKTSI